MITSLIVFASLSSGLGQTIQKPPNRPPLQAIPLPGQKPQGRQLPGIRKIVPELWGWADLHCHPANHLGYGADTNGNGGIFWGKPGLGLTTSNVNTDLPQCPVDSHTGFDADAVRKGTRKVVIGQLDNLTGLLHGTLGAPTFQDWPHANSLLHQQMHIRSIRRAYNGGQRIMIASVADNQMLSNLWSKVAYNAFQSIVPAVDPTFDYQSAKRQIQYIRNMVSANQTWMAIVKTPSELDYAQILDLVTQWDGRSVIPVHLTDNSFGGSALYVDLFNSVNHYLNGSFFSVVYDPRVKFRLGRPSVLKGGQLGSIVPTPIEANAFEKLGYRKFVNGVDQISEGHRNAKGLNKPEFQKLMKLGLLLDVAHMSQESMNDALTLADTYQFPLMNSHTGMRDAQEHSHSEREIRRSDARRIAAHGGVIGIGTEGKTIVHTLFDESRPLVHRFQGGANEWSSPMRNASIHNAPLCGFRLTIGTGDDGLRGGNDNVYAELRLHGGILFQFANLNRSIGLDKGTTYTFHLPTPDLILNQIDKLTIRTNFSGQFGSDVWDVKQFKLTAIIRTHEPVTTFTREISDLLSVMGGKGIAFGTDLNGFAPQVPFTPDPITYPHNVANRYGPANGGFVPLPMGKAYLGTRAYDFKTDGLAHYGMLPDLLQAMSSKPNSEPVLQALFRSANAVVTMWERAEAAKRRVP
jgi:microsomal dipeptidase-like Zn-dependent dipeptidase